MNILEKLSPPGYACSWDNVGLHVGRKENTVTKLLITLDIDDNAVQLALEEKVDMIISHHPLIFRGIKQINEDDIVGRRILTMIENGINAYCMHTNFDCVGGMGSLAADRLSIVDATVLEEVCDGEGIGRIGMLPNPLSVMELCELVKNKFDLEHVVLYGDPKQTVTRLAIVPGSGKEEIELALKGGAQAIITGDVSYHFGIDGMAANINVIDAGHYGIEHIFIDYIRDYLAQNTDNLEIITMPINNPQKYI